MNHPHAICHGLIPPDDRLDSGGWVAYRERAVKWQTDLQMHAHIEKGRGGISAETKELLSECSDTIAWADEHISDCLYAQLEPDEFLEREVLIGMFEEESFKDSWRKYFARRTEQGERIDLHQKADNFHASGLRFMGDIFERMAREEDSLKRELIEALSY